MILLLDFFGLIAVLAITVVIALKGYVVMAGLFLGVGLTCLFWSTVAYFVIHLL